MKRVLGGLAAAVAALALAAPTPAMADTSDVEYESDVESGIISIYWGGALRAQGQYLPASDNFRVRDRNSDGDRAYIAYAVEGGASGTCVDKNGAGLKWKTCDRNFLEGRRIRWQLCTQDVSQGENPRCSPIFEERT